MVSVSRDGTFSALGRQYEPAGINQDIDALAADGGGQGFLVHLVGHLYREWLGQELAWEQEGKSRFGKVASRMIRAALRNESVFAAIGDPPPIIEIFIDTDFDGYNPKAKVMPLKLLAPITPFHGHGFISHFGHDDWL